jgi:predicted transcriptional regulator
MRFRFIVYLAQPLALDGASSPPLSKTEPTEQVNEQVSEQVKRLLLCLQRQPLAVREIMETLQLNHRPTLLYDYLKPAIDGGFVEMTQPDSPKSPTQKYRLTKKGA